jgi:hypothetical protein
LPRIEVSQDRRGAPHPAPLLDDRRRANHRIRDRDHRLPPPSGIGRRSFIDNRFAAVATSRTGIQTTQYRTTTSEKQISRAEARASGSAGAGTGEGAGASSARSG